jgi:two-component system OmpR family response regulator
LARVRAQIRRSALAAADHIVKAADVELDLLRRSARCAGTPVLLSPTEFEFLMRHCGQVLSRAQIQKAVWGYEHDPATNVVDVYIGYLRRKLHRPDAPAPIVTVRAAGYSFTTGTGPGRGRAMT